MNNSNERTPRTPSEGSAAGGSIWPAGRCAGVAGSFSRDVVGELTRGGLVEERGAGIGSADGILLLRPPRGPSSANLAVVALCRLHRSQYPLTHVRCQPVERGVTIVLVTIGARRRGRGQQKKPDRCPQATVRPIISSQASVGRQGIAGRHSGLNSINRRNQLGLATEADLVGERNALVDLASFRRRSLGLGRRRRLAAAVAATAGDHSVATMASMAATARVATTGPQAGQQPDATTAVAAVAGADATAAITASASMATVAAVAGHCLALTAQKGDANHREKDRDAQNQCSIHPGFLQETGTVTSGIPNYLPPFALLRLTRRDGDARRRLPGWTA